MAAINYKAKVTSGIKVKLIASVIAGKVGLSRISAMLAESAKRSLKFEPVK